MYKSYVIVHDANGQPKEQLDAKKSTLQFEETALSTTNDSSWWWILAIPFVLLFLVAGVGPWYHDCGDPDKCVTQREACTVTITVSMGIMALVTRRP